MASLGNLLMNTDVPISPGKIKEAAWVGALAPMLSVANVQASPLPVLGDLDGDGVVTGRDIMLLMRIVDGLDTGAFTLVSPTAEDPSSDLSPAVQTLSQGCSLAVRTTKADLIAAIPEDRSDKVFWSLHLPDDASVTVNAVTTAKVLTLMDPYLLTSDAPHFRGTHADCARGRDFPARVNPRPGIQPGVFPVSRQLIAPPNACV